MTLAAGEGPWGVCSGSYPDAIAVETTGFPNVIYHEALHMFDLKDGYDPVTKATLDGCEACWMQWEPTRGTGLCARHEEELRSCLRGTVQS